MVKLQLFNTYTFAGEHYRSVKRPRYVIFNITHGTFIYFNSAVEDKVVSGESFKDNNTWQIQLNVVMYYQMGKLSIVHMLC
jgi:hypothetical protein